MNDRALTTPADAPLLVDAKRAAAMSYARRGWPVFPLHTIKDGCCTCGNSKCSSPGKHPRTRHGLRDATTDPDVIRRWWTRWPDANVGIRTGAVSGIIVADIDPRHGGDGSLAELVREHGPLCNTVEAITGGGGRHIVFAHPGGVIRNKANLLPGIDVRGDGGYIVAPPSRHVCGAYRWKPDHSPHDLPPAAAPPWLLQRLAQEPAGTERRAGRPAKSPSGDDLSLLPEAAMRYVAKAPGAAEGRRNNVAFNLAGHLVAFELEGSGRRLTERQIIDLLRSWNHRNTPPLPDHELPAVVGSAMTTGTPREPHIVKRTGPADRPKRTGRTTGLKRPTPLPWRPFPVHVLPDPLGRLVVEVAAAIGCDHCYIALPVLAVCAACIGTTRRIRLKRSWHEPIVLWCVCVGRSGTLKSPPLDVALEPLRRRERDAFRVYAEVMEQYKGDVLTYERDVVAWKRSKIGGEPPQKPERPTCERFTTSDTTIEALARLLHENPRGLLLARDELAGLFQSFDAYRSGRGGDASRWLELQRAGRLLVDRKTGDCPTLRLERAAVSMAGTIQPGTMRRVLTREHYESGLAARLLLAMPPSRQKRWTENELSPATEAAYTALIDKLLSLRPNTDAGDDAAPIDLPLSPAGKAAWIAFYNHHAAEQAALPGDDLAAAYSKLEAYAARLALVIHFVRWAANDPALGSTDVVDEASIEAGATLARWFAHEAQRVYEVLHEDEGDAEHRRLVEWIQGRGGSVTARDLTRNLRSYPTTTDARAALEALVEAGHGRWIHPQPDPQGGPPAKRFELADSPDADTTSAGDAETPGYVGVGSVAASDDEGWAEV